MLNLKKALALLCSLIFLFSAVSCAKKEQTLVPGGIPAEQSQTSEQDHEHPTEEEDLYGVGVIPEPEGLLYDQSVPTSITVDASKHEPLLLWKDRAHTPYWDESLGGTTDPHLLPYIKGDGQERACVIVCPGGGYSYLSNDNEGAVIADYINKEWDLNAFVLQYRVAPYDYNAILTDVLRAVRYVRYYAKDLGVDPEKIVVMGFSAGGHLACMAAEKFDDGKVGDAIDHVSSRPDAAILCYPVITLFESYKHAGSADRFLGASKDSEVLAKFFSGEKAVREDMPPVFVVHSKKDGTVNYQNSQALANAMTAIGASCTLKLYEQGGHGFGLALNSTKDSAKWKDDCLAWLKELEIAK
jgi:acetyl esterase/lipase